LTSQAFLRPPPWTPVIFAEIDAGATPKRQESAMQLIESIDSLG
jgi:hypothetical protein